MIRVLGLRSSGCQFKLQSAATLGTPGSGIAIPNVSPPHTSSKFTFALDAFDMLTWA